MAEMSETAQCPSCGAAAEPEQDGDVLFYACECGFYFGYQAMTAEANTCAAGLPLAHLTTDPVFQSRLADLTPEETDRLLWGKSKPKSESAVFLGSVIPLRPEEN